MTRPVPAPRMRIVPEVERILSDALTDSVRVIKPIRPAVAPAADTARKGEAE